MMTWIQLGRHRKPIVLVNHDGFWQPLVALLDHMKLEGFLPRADDAADLYQVVGEVDEVLPVLERAAARLPKRADETATTRLM